MSRSEPSPLRLVFSRWVCAWGAVLVFTGSGCKMAADGQNLQGVRYFQQGQYDAAMQTFEKAVATDPKNPNTYYNMAATLHRTGAARNDQNMLARAETLYNQSLDLGGNEAECYRGLAVLLAETGRSDRAFALLKNWSAREPQSAEPRIELARLYEEYGDLDNAKTNLTEALQVDQQNARAWNALARLREQSGEYAQALANYQQSYSVNPFQPEVSERIASLSRSLAQAGTPAPPPATQTATTIPSITR